MREAGELFIVATPIGNLEDLSKRAISVLNSVQKIAAEDTRHSIRLLNHLGIRNKLMSLHEHNERDRIDGIIDDLTPDAEGYIHAPTGPGLGANIDFELIESKKITTLS